MEYGYDDYGEQVTQSTFRGGTGWDASAWPAGPGTADTTTWAYDAATGLLTSKTDAAGHAVSYTYNLRGQLATRTWARGTVATYGYSAVTAEQTGITYSDSTPALSYTYNRMGQTAAVTDVTGTRTFAYSTATTALASETFPGYFDSRVLTRKYDASTSGALGRNIGFTLSGSGGSGTESDVAYGYDATGRFNQVGLPAPGASFAYSFTTGSNLVATIAEVTGGAWTETNSYEAHRNLLTGIDGQFGAAVIAQFAYVHDALGRRTSVADSGQIFARYVNAGLVTTYGYNDRSEVTAAQSYYGTNPADLSSPVAARGFAYAFDNIGSRTSSSVVGNGPGDVQTTSYTNNNLNQVTARTSPGSTNVTGLAPAAAAVTVNGAAAVRQGDYYYKNVAAGSTPAWQSLAIASSLGGSSTRYSYLAATPESYAYDLDGNVTDDGRWHYVWDAENRLVSMETSLTTSVLATGVPRQFLQFKYDYLGRRVRKTVSNWNGSAYVAAVDRKFIYNGWNLVGEYNAGSPSTLVNTYLWGLDLSGNLTDGGGVGGLLAIMDTASGTIHLPAYDANGNIHALVNRAVGTVTAAYEYSPFGETLRATGSYAAANAFRFSTKYTDSETQFIYYGYRYYSPTLGRWLGRDPLEEKGGLHLYAFCGNNAVNSWDMLGMTATWNITADPPDDDAAFLSVHSNFSKVNGITWYDPDTDTNWVYNGEVTPYNYSAENYEAPSMGASLMAADDAALAAWRQSNDTYTNDFLETQDAIAQSPTPPAATPAPKSSPSKRN